MTPSSIYPAAPKGGTLDGKLFNNKNEWTFRTTTPKSSCVSIVNGPNPFPPEAMFPTHATFRGGPITAIAVGDAFAGTGNVTGPLEKLLRKKLPFNSTDAVRAVVSRTPKASNRITLFPCPKNRPLTVIAEPGSSLGPQEAACVTVPTGVQGAQVGFIPGLGRKF